MDTSIELQPVYVRVSQNKDESNVIQEDEYSQTESFISEIEPPVPPKKRCAKLRPCIFGFLLVSILISFTIFVVSGLILGARVHQCLVPAHHKDLYLPLSPDQIKGLELYVVAGTISISSCPFAKNISIHAKASAHSTALLNEMDIQTTVNSDGVVEVIAAGPSFDMNHCQLSHITVVIPKSLRLNVHAHVVSGRVDVNGHFNNLKLTTSIGYIHATVVDVSNHFQIEMLAGYASVHNTIANSSLVEVETGFVNMQNSYFAQKAELLINVGCIKTRGLGSPKTIAMSVSVGAICAQDFSVIAQLLDVNVDYGFLRLKPVDGHAFYFEMRTHYGVIDVLPDMEQPKYVLLSREQKTGYFGEVAADAAADVVRVTTAFGRASLYTRNSVAVYDN